VIYNTINVYQRLYKIKYDFKWLYLIVAKANRGLVIIWLASMLIFIPQPVNGSITGVLRGRCPNYQFLSSNCINSTSIRTLSKVRGSSRSTRSIIRAIDGELEIQCTPSVKLAYNKYMCTSITVNVHWAFVRAIEPFYINQVPNRYNIKILLKGFNYNKKIYVNQ